MRVEGKRRRQKAGEKKKNVGGRERGEGRERGNLRVLKGILERNKGVEKGEEKGESLRLPRPRFAIPDICVDVVELPGVFWVFFLGVFLGRFFRCFFGAVF